MDIREHGTSIVPSAPKPRQILALLALRAGHVVPVPTLMEEIWGDGLPRSAATTLQTYILQLRRKVTAAHRDGHRAAGKELLATRYGGYLLNCGPVTSDIAEFEHQAARGSAALDAGDAGTAAAVLGRALDLWRGPALVDVPAGRVLGLELLGMEEGRMRALEQRIEADLLLGRHSGLLGELRMLSARHPMHEGLCAQFMLALYRAGSAWRALEAYQGLRRTLVEELGIDPSPRLQRLHQAVLTGDPALDRPELVGAGRPQRLG
nr:AfsR/SARP family transcriptional regulator [Streptomyces sp. SID4948]